MSAATPLRVLQLCAPGRAGGLETVVRQLAVGLREQSVDAHVAVVLDPSEAEGHPFADALESDGTTVHRIVLGARAYRREREAVARVLSTTGAHVLHTHGYRSDVMDGPVARQGGVPHVVTLHGFTGGSWRGRFYEWLQVRAAVRADATIVVSSAIERRVRAAGGGARVRLIRNAMRPPHLSMHRDAARQALGLPSDIPVVGWVGRLSIEKGPDLLVEALAQLRGEAHVVVIGDGSMRQSLQDRVGQLGMSSRVTFAGLRANAAELFGALDLLALTSRTEGTPMVLLEAMWAGVPIVATSVGGVPDILGHDDAWLTTPEAGAIASALDAALIDPEARRTRAAHAVARVQRTHDVDSWIAAHAAIYREVSFGRARRALT